MGLWITRSKTSGRRRYDSSFVKMVVSELRVAQVEWAARAKLVKEADNWKISFYRVYMIGDVSP